MRKLDWQRGLIRTRLHTPHLYLDIQSPKAWLTNLVPIPISDLEDMLIEIDQVEAGVVLETRLVSKQFSSAKSTARAGYSCRYSVSGISRNPFAFPGPTHAERTCAHTSPNPRHRFGVSVSQRQSRQWILAEKFPLVADCGCYVKE